MINIVEILAEESYTSPCLYGNIVAGHACYCHAKQEEAPRKCPVWSHFGERDLSKWNVNGDFNLDGWEGGCKWFVPK